MRLWALPLILVAVLGSSWLPAQYQRNPPDFGGTYEFPSPTHPEPRAAWLRAADIGVLALGLSLAAWLVLRRRSRRGVVLLSVVAIAYFGFYREGCICPIGAIQNVTLSLVDPRYGISVGVLAFFLLPLAAALLFGRVFCSGVCPFGALQDLVLMRPLKVPPKLDRILGWLPYVYLGAAVFFAGWGLRAALGAWKIQTGRRFIICEWDPFIGFFRMTGPFHMLALGAAFLLAGLFIGRPYCRWLCPYGALLALFSRVAWKNVQVTPDRELDCGLCADACPYGAIENLRAKRATCLACARCYQYCPREAERQGGPEGPGTLVQVEPS
jgi:hypothetical protein